MLRYSAEILRFGKRVKHLTANAAEYLVKGEFSQEKAQLKQEIQEKNKKVLNKCLFLLEEEKGIQGMF